MTLLRRLLSMPLVFLGSAAFICWGGLQITDLGFYHDDWPLLLRLQTSNLPLWPRLLAEYANGVHLYRPLTPFAWTLPHAAFGLNPLPWQFLALSINLLMAGSVYRLLRRFDLSTEAAALCSVLFLAYPNKDATLFWPDVALILTFSLAMFTESYLRHLDYVTHGRSRDRWLSAVCLLACFCAYEQCFFLLPLWLITPEGSGRARVGASLKSAAAAWTAFAFYKFLLLPALFPYPKSLEISVLRIGYTVYTALRTHFDPRYWLYLGGCLLDALRAHPWLSLTALALPWAAAWAAPRPGRSSGAWRLILLGLGFFVLGYLPIALSTYVPTPYNMMNRLNQIPALGVVLVMAGLWARRPDTRQARVAMALLCGAFLTIHITFADYWVESYRQQHEVGTLVKQHSAQWPADKTLIVRLRTRYVGERAPVFDAYYDVSAALNLWTGQRRPADIWSPRMTPKPKGLFVEGRVYPYDEVLLLDVPAGTLAPATYQDFRQLPPATASWERD
jgi:hypothetical protein